MPRRGVGQRESLRALAAREPGSIAAITAYVDPVPSVEVAAPGREREGDRATTTVSGLQAVRLEFEAGGDALWPDGTPITIYGVDLSRGPAGTADDGPRTLFLDTVGTESFDYERNQVVLDRIARTLRVTLDDVPAEPAVVARYEGASGFRVEGRVTASHACLRIRRLPERPAGEPQGRA